MLALSLLSALALAQDAVTLDLVGNAQVGHGAPRVTIHSNIHGAVQVQLSCGGRSYGTDWAAQPGTQLDIDLDGLPQGQHRCSGELSLDATDGTTGSMPLGFDVAMLPPLLLQVDRSQLHLAERRLTVRGSRPLARVTVQAQGPRGVELGRGEVGANSDLVDVEWSGSDADEVIRLVVTGWDADELPGRIELFPWSYAIPHQDVVFDSGKSEITGAEAPKLESAWDELVAVRDKYGDVARIQLYVAGYTDTVGDAASNQALSDARARSIASWFRQRGFDGPVHYQGFGESVLAKPTPDGTDEAANRRAIYLLAADTPALSDEVPKSAWRALE